MRLHLFKHNAFKLALAFWLMMGLGLSPYAAKAAETTSAAQLEQLVAPIALYPDSLLSQVLMASTYPLEVVEAQRWLQQQPAKSSAAQIQQAVQSQDWDVSVKSLTSFPDVLAMMNDQLDWTQQLGNAFLAQQKDVMDAVQRLRTKARDAGNLQSGEQQTVIVESGPSTVIKIEPAQPDVVYVPTYNPTVVYGAWPYPSYPPVQWYPPGYTAAGLALSFTAGLIVGDALWGEPDWHHGDVNIDVNRYNQFNRTNVVNDRWEHNPAHRGNVDYPNSATRARFQSVGGEGPQTRSRPARGQPQHNLQEHQPGTTRRTEGSAPRRDHAAPRDATRHTRPATTPKAREPQSRPTRPATEQRQPQRRQPSSGLRETGQPRLSEGHPGLRGGGAGGAGGGAHERLRR